VSPISSVLLSFGRASGLRTAVSYHSYVVYHQLVVQSEKAIMDEDYEKKRTAIGLFSIRIFFLSVFSLEKVVFLGIKNWKKLYFGYEIFGRSCIFLLLKVGKSVQTYGYERVRLYDEGMKGGRD